MDEETAILLAVIERMKNCGGTGTTYIQDDEIVKKCETARTSISILRERNKLDTNYFM